MFAAGFAEGAGTVNPVTAGYLRRAIDYRSVLGEIIRKHLGAQFDPANPYVNSQLSRIIPAYASSGEKLYSGGQSSLDGVNIRGELGIL